MPNVEVVSLDNAARELVTCKIPYNEETLRIHDILDPDPDPQMYLCL
jgi:hypothetical protein